MDHINQINNLTAAAMFSPPTALSSSIALFAAQFSQTRKVADQLATDIALASATAVATLPLHQERPEYSELPEEITRQLRQDGTRGGLRSHEDAEALYDNLPESINNLQDAQAVVDSPNYEGGHLIPHSDGGSSDPANITYMPTAINRQIGDRIPTPEELQDAAAAVEAEGYLFDSAIADGMINLAAGAAAPATARLAGVASKLAGGAIRNDPKATSQALAELPEQLTHGLYESATRGIPAAIGSAFGPAGLVAGFVAADFAEGAMSPDPTKQFNCYASGCLKAGALAAGISCPPIGFAMGAIYLAKNFFNW